jgi:hypothetical protein
MKRRRRRRRQLPVVVLEDPQLRDLARQCGGSYLVVAPRDPEKDEDAWADRTARRSARARDALDDGSHSSRT